MGSIKGIVKNSSNAPLRDVNVLIDEGPSHPDISAITDENGTFGFSDLQPGYYTIRAYGREESEPVRVHVLPQKTAFVEIWLESVLVDEGSNVVDEEMGREEESTWIAADPSLPNSTWKVRSIRAARASSQQGSPNTYMLRFLDQSRFFLQLDINRCDGDYRIPNKGRIKFLNMSCTESGFDTDFAQDLARLFPQMSEYEMIDHMLMLRGKGEIWLTKL